MFVLFFGGLAHAQDQHEGWTHGFGTGMQGLNLESDVGLGTLLGPVTMELDLDSSEVSDLIETAFGLGS